MEKYGCAKIMGEMDGSNEQDLGRVSRKGQNIK